MYYQIEGRMNMKTILFDEEGITVGEQTYPIDEVEKLEITSATLFATYGILTIRTNGKNIPVPFARSAIEKVRRAIHDFEHEQQVRRKAAEKAAEVPPAATAERTFAPVSPRTSADRGYYMDPYEEVKKLKELLDMGIVTEEEFQKKKKELLGL
ncbi:MAG: SHOCT domain-containing protein [Lachnospiraceae bacterium]|nr:SHOCT domain-containing protein [Lachnospiraceae bacterium]